MKPAPAMSPAELRRLVGGINRGYAGAYNARSVADLLGFFAAGAVSLPPGTAPIRGIAAHRRFFRAVFRREGGRNLVLSSLWTRAAGDLLVDAGRWRQSMPAPGGGRSSMSGYYLSALRRSAGGWRIAATTCNFDPARAARPRR